MNCYIDQFNNKYYCLSPVNKECQYNIHQDYDGLTYPWHGLPHLWNVKDKNILHRIDGAAVEYCNGSKDWYYEGKLHREDGPAEEFGHYKKNWWYHGE